MALRELLADFRVKVSGLKGLQQANTALNQTAVAAKRADGAFQDAAGRWRAANGRFLTMSERAKLLGKSVEDMGGKVAAGSSTAAKGLDLFSIKSLAVVYGIQRVIGGIVRLSDEYTTLQNRLRFVTKTQAEAADVEERLFQISQKNFTSIGDTANAYQRISIATRRQNLGQERTLNFVDRVQQAFQLTGATTAEAQGAMIQFTQALGQNFLAVGEEINSIVDGAPVLAKIIEDSIGNGTKTLKQLNKEGLLTTEKVIAAVEGAGVELDKAFARRAPKFADGVTIMGNALVRFTGRVQNASGASETFAGITRGFINILGAIEKPLTKLVGQVDLLRFALILAGVALAPFVAGWAAAAASALVAAAPFIALALVLDDIIATFQGGDSVIRRFFDGLFGEGETAKSVENIKLAFSSLWDIVKGLFRFLTGDLSLDGFIAIFNKAAAGMKLAWDTAIDGMIARALTIGDAFAGVWARIKVLAAEAFEFMRMGAVELIKDLPGGETILSGLKTAGGLVSSGIDAAKNLVQSTGGFGSIPEPRTAGAVSNSTTNTNTSVGNRSVTVNVQSAEPRQIAGAVDRVLESDRNAILARIP